MQIKFNWKQISVLLCDDNNKLFRFLCTFSKYNLILKEISDIQIEFSIYNEQRITFG